MPTVYEQARSLNERMQKFAKDKGVSVWAQVEPTGCVVRGIRKGSTVSGDWKPTLEEAWTSFLNRYQGWE